MTFSHKLFSRHFRRGEFAEADRVCREEVAINPANGYAWHFRGLVALRNEDFHRAVQFILRAIFHNPGICEMHVNLGVALRALGRLDEAVDALTEAARLDPSNFESRLLLATCRLQRSEFDDANRTIAEALALEPDSAEAWELQALIAHRLSNFDRAFDAARKAVSISPRAASYRVIGDVSTRRENYTDAHKAYHASITLDPSDPEARANFAVLLTRMGRHEEAVRQYREALSRSGDNHQAQFGLSTALLALGQFEEGWPLYAARTRALRVKIPEDIPVLERLPEPGERVLLTTDQGPGEQILFAGLLTDLIGTRADLAVAGDDRLVPLMQRSYPSIRFLGSSSPGPEMFDSQIGLADTGRWLRRSFSDFPAHEGYLKPDPYLENILRSRATAVAPGNLLVGISWRTAAGAKVSTQKTIPLRDWEPILTVPGVTFVSLQYGDTDEEISTARSAFGVEIFKEPSVNATLDLDSLAAQIASMDLVITTSNTTAHLAGALHVPTWVFVPKGFGGFWHWFLERRDSPWYPSAQLFRQSERRNWRPVLSDAAGELASLVHTRRAAT